MREDTEYTQGEDHMKKKADNGVKFLLTRGLLTTT